VSASACLVSALTRCAVALRVAREAAELRRRAVWRLRVA
jgi:hypothetical protein